MKQNQSKQLKIWPAMRRPLTLALAVAFAAGSVASVGATVSKANGSKKPNIVLVHGAWADGSCWSAVIQRLQEDGYNVIAPQFPLTSLADNVARLREVLAVQDGPTIVVGHSYGGQIITALGTDAPDAVRLFGQRMGATTVEVKSSHVAMVSHPKDVTKLIETAAKAVKVTP